MIKPLHSGSPSCNNALVFGGKRGELAESMDCHSRWELVVAEMEDVDEDVHGGAIVVEESDDVFVCAATAICGLRLPCGAAKSFEQW